MPNKQNSNLSSLAPISAQSFSIQLVACDPQSYKCYLFWSQGWWLTASAIRAQWVINSQPEKKRLADNDQMMTLDITLWRIWTAVLSFFAPVPQVNTAILYWLSDDFDIVVMLEENSGHHQHRGVHPPGDEDNRTKFHPNTLMTCQDILLWIQSGGPADRCHALCFTTRTAFTWSNKGGNMSNRTRKEAKGPNHILRPQIVRVH